MTLKRKIGWVSQHFEFNGEGRLYQPDEEDEQIEADLMEQGIEPLPINMMTTPFGVWAIDDTMNPMRQFKLWMGHTNFPIDESVFHIIDNATGVEVFKVLTKYRFLIGVGEMFDFRDVRTTLEKLLCGNQTFDEQLLLLDENMQQELLSIKSELDKQKKPWYILVLPNGAIDYCYQEESQKTSYFQQAVNNVGALLLESEL